MNSSKGISIAALVCGILGLVAIIVSAMPLITWLLFAASICGIIFGGIGMSKSKAENGSASGLAIAGLVLGIIGAVLGLIGVICASCVCVVAGPLGCANPDYVALASAANKLASYGF